MAFVEYQRNGAIALVTLNRSERLNALSVELGSDLKDACQKFENDPQARVLILSASGRAFSAGADVKEAGHGRARMDAGPKAALDAVQNVTKPVIAAVNGLAVGVGCILMMGCDIRIAAASDTFSIAEIKLAIPAGPENLLAENIPLCVAMELVLTGDPITAQRAYEIGLINRVVPDEDLISAATEIAGRIAQLAPSEVRLIRKARLRAVQAAQSMWKSDQEGEITRAEIFETADFKEAVRAFMEKRRPVWRT